MQIIICKKKRHRVISDVASFLFGPNCEYFFEKLLKHDLGNAEILLS